MRHQSWALNWKALRSGLLAFGTFTLSPLFLTYSYSKLPLMTENLIMNSSLSNTLTGLTTKWSDESEAHSSLLPLLIFSVYGPILTSIFFTPHVPPHSFTLRVSSVFNDDKQFRKQHLIDGQPDTCWNSDEVSEHESPSYSSHFVTLLPPLLHLIRRFLASSRTFSLSYPLSYYHLSDICRENLTLWRSASTFPSTSVVWMSRSKVDSLQSRSPSLLADSAAPTTATAPAAPLLRLSHHCRRMVLMIRHPQAQRKMIIHHHHHLHQQQRSSCSVDLFPSRRTIRTVSRVSLSPLIV